MRLLTLNNIEKCSLVNKHSLEDGNLSWKARGIHCYLMTKPQGCTINTSDLLSKASDDEASLLAGIKELIRGNYLFPIVRKVKGRVVECDYFVSPIPLNNENAAVEIRKLKRGDWEIYKHSNH